jgi:hypothetical protein
MRRFKRILKWSIVPLVIELSILFYANNFYLTGNLKLNILKENRQESKISFSGIKVPVPDDATMINASYDGKYVSYFTNGTLKVINTQDNSEEIIKFPNNIKANYYQWLPDRDRLLIAEKNNVGIGNYYYTISYYDMREKERVELSDDSGKVVKISIPDSKYVVDSIALSTLTNATYIKVSKDGIKNRIYRIDAMSQIESFLNNNYKIGAIATLNRNDKFIYEDLTHKRVGIIGKNTSYISDIINPYVLGIDSEDNLYIGSANGTKVTTIFYKNMDNTVRKWETLKLPESVGESNIHITKEGQIYVDDSLRGVLTEVKSGKEIKYTGKFIDIVKGGVVTLADGKIKGVSIQ